MKNCQKCNTVLEDDARFCKNCGAECGEGKKKFHFAEKRIARERETQEILSKASLQEEDIDDIAMFDNKNLKFSVVGNLKKTYIHTWAIIIAMVVLVIFAFVSGLLLKRIDGHDTERVIGVFALMLLGGFGVAVITDKSYYLRVMLGMRKSQFAIKKISYGKAPQMNYNGTLYRIEIVCSCKACLTNSNMHIEELNGSFIAVCDTNRLHLMQIDTKEINFAFDPTTCSLDETKLSLYRQAKLSDIKSNEQNCEEKEENSLPLAQNNDNTTTDTIK